MLVDQSLFGDELFTYDETRGSLAAVFDGMARNEVNPPLYYVFAWLSQQLGGSPSWLRLPSLLAGTAVIPLVYALGRRVSGVTAGLVASALMALSPFALFYSTEARAYSMAMALSAASTLFLLRALERDSFAIWSAYGLVVCAAMYTHYTTIFIIVVQAAWALAVRRDRARQLLLVYAAAAAAYLAWVPSLVDQRDDPIKLAVVGGDTDVSVGTLLELVSRLIPGHPYVGLDDLPGIVPIVLLAVALAAAAVTALVHAMRDRVMIDASSPALLVVLLAFATPVGVLAYSALSTNLMSSRNLTASLPLMAVALGMLAAALRPWQTKVVTSVALAAMAVGAVRAMDDDYQRPDYRKLGAYVDDAARPTDAVIGIPPTSGPFSLAVFFRRPHPLTRINVDDGAAWRSARRGGSTFLILPLNGFFTAPSPYGGPDARLILRDERRFKGLVDTSVARYSGVIDARLERVGVRPRIALSEGGAIAIRPGVARGYVEKLGIEGRRLSVEGWALAGRRAVDWIVVFAGSRLVAGAVPVYPRPDVGKVEGGPIAAAGFVATGLVPRAGQAAGAGRLRVFAVVGDRASELPRLRR
jgi:hypothetical protein